MQFLKALNPFSPPVAKTLLVNNLEEYERNLLVQEASAAYHTKMAEYYREGIERLKQQQVA